MEYFTDLPEPLIRKIALTRILLDEKEKQLIRQANTELMFLNYNLGQYENYEERIWEEEENNDLSVNEVLDLLDTGFGYYHKRTETMLSGLIKTFTKLCKIKDIHFPKEILQFKHQKTDNQLSDYVEYKKEFFNEMIVKLYNFVVKNKFDMMILNAVLTVKNQ